MPIGVIVYALLLFVFPHSTSSTTGVAPNEIELDAILTFKCLTR
jgi:hypothetical protein